MFHGRRHAFTLVELLIVLSVLGILAALVVPKFQTSAGAARDTSATVQLTIARKILQAWHTDHAGEFPTLAQMQEGERHWAGFIGRTDTDGTLNANGDHGPYLSKEPVNVLMASSLVADAGSATPDDGWTYDELTGKLRLIVPAGMDLADFGLLADDMEQLIR